MQPIDIRLLLLQVRASVMMHKFILSWTQCEALQPLWQLQSLLKPLSLASLVTPCAHAAIKRR